MYTNGAIYEYQGKYYYQTKRGPREFISKRAMQSWGIKPFKAVELSKVVAKLGFRDRSLIKNVVDNKLWIIEDGKRRLITDPDVLVEQGYSKRDIVVVSKKEIEYHVIGDDL